MKRLLAIALLVLSISSFAAGPEVSGYIPKYHTTALQTAATTGNGVVVNLQCPAETIFYVIWSAGTGAGVVTIETANTKDYAGTWAPLATVTWASASTISAVQVSGCMTYVRARISTTVTGGTVSVEVDHH